MDIADLINRLEKSEGPSRKLNADILEITGGCAHRETEYYCIEDGNDTDSGFTCKRCGKDTYGERVPAFTGSVDAAIALCERVLPGWTIYFEATDGIAKDVYLIGPEYRDDRPEQNASPSIGGKPTAIALCIAILIAVQRVKEQQP